MDQSDSLSSMPTSMPTTSAEIVEPLLYYSVANYVRKSQLISFHIRSKFFASIYYSSDFDAFGAHTLPTTMETEEPTRETLSLTRSSSYRPRYEWLVAMPSLGCRFCPARGLILASISLREGVCLRLFSSATKTTDLDWCVTAVFTAMTFTKILYKQESIRRQLSGHPQSHPSPPRNFLQRQGGMGSPVMRSASQVVSFDVLCDWSQILVPLHVISTWKNKYNDQNSSLARSFFILITTSYHTALANTRIIALAKFMIA